MHSDPHSRARFLTDEALIAALAPDDERWLGAHRQDCPECAAYAELTSRIVRGLSGISFDYDAAMTARVRQALAAQLPPRRATPGWRVALIAAALLIAVAPIYESVKDKRRQAEKERADTQLMERVDERLSQTLPEAMEPLAQPAPLAPQGASR